MFGFWAMFLYEYEELVLEHLFHVESARENTPDLTITILISIDFPK